MEHNPDVTAYIEKLNSPRREICSEVRNLLGDRFPELTEDYKWSRPVYRVESGSVCYMVANKADVNVGFDRGAELEDPSGVLAGSGKSMRHIKLKKSEDVNRDQIAGFVRQAIELQTS